ncbi:cysteine peptidase family C39 domain-containing protein [Polaribacter sp. Z022]|uniref:cysteine peptidase family C39 domain-containing protein n=1 Tax=Polaribacter sp. Z022 TaxID=2927125 RepID=UPI0032E515FF
MAKITIKQHDITDYGAACLASISAHYNLQLPIARIRQYAGTDKKGTNVIGLIEAAEKLGFEAKGVRGELDSLFKIPKPATAHIIAKKQLHHYVVIYEVTKDFIKIMDPGDGKIHKKTHEDFLKETTVVLVLLLPKVKFTTGNKKS